MALAATLFEDQSAAFTGWTDNLEGVAHARTHARARIHRRRLGGRFFGQRFVISVPQQHCGQSEVSLGLHVLLQRFG